jgi:hypothetical protein
LVDAFDEANRYLSLTIVRNPSGAVAAPVELLPRAPRGQPPFDWCENHLLLAEQAGLGTADLARIEILASPVTSATQNYQSPFGGG